MNDSKSQTVGGAFPTFQRLFGSLFTWRTMRRCLFVLVCLLTLIALFYAGENWRGARRWNKYRRELEARGVQLDYRVFIPKPVPDGQNFAATPFVRSWFLKENRDGKMFDADDYGRTFRRVSDPQNKDWGRHPFLDLVAWKMAFAAIRSGATNLHLVFFTTNRADLETRARAAPAVLEGLKTSEASLAELRAASQLHYSRYPVDYDLENPWGILLPHFARIIGSLRRVQLRACAELAVGRSEDALEDVRLMLYLADSLKEEPFLVSYFQRIACFINATQPVWEGLAEHRWSDSQLQELQTRLRQYNFLADMTHPLNGERAAGILTADLLYRGRCRPSELFDQADSSGALADFVSRVAPHGWYYLEQLNYCRLYEDQLNGTFDEANKRVSVKQVQSRAQELEREIAGGRLGRTLHAVVHHQLLAAMLLPALGRVSLNAATAQTTTDQAVLACALERFRLANGQFPERLDALVPRFLDRIPNDVISGEPLRYRRRDNGQFVLYSVGWNEKDDGGMPGKSLFDEKTGDWVWRYPEK